MYSNNTVGQILKLIMNLFVRGPPSGFFYFKNHELQLMISTKKYIIKKKKILYRSEKKQNTIF